MKLRRNNFTSPLPAGAPVSVPKPAQPPIQRHESEIVARAFRINYAILCVALLPLTVAIAALLEFEDIFVWLGLYGLCCVGGYSWLHNRHYPAPKVKYAPQSIPGAASDMAKIAEQVARHSQPQSHSNRLANYVPVIDAEVTGFDREELAPPTFMIEQTVDVDAYVDVVRDALLNLLTKLYRRDDAGNLVNVRSDGALQDGIVVPWSKRGGLTEGQRRQALDLIEQIRMVGGWLIRYDETLRKWKLNVASYSTFDAACEILDKCTTRVV
ncbi:MAG: hypothetical protein U0350_40055 [Caldilineaceae bacterium]